MLFLSAVLRKLVKTADGCKQVRIWKYEFGSAIYEVRGTKKDTKYEVGNTKYEGKKTK